MKNYKQTLDSLIRCLGSTAGRDKISRFTQYFCKFLFSINNLHQLKKIEQNMSLVRKILRFGSPLRLITIFIKLFQQLQTEKPLILTSSQILRNLMFLIFILLDHLSYFFKVSISSQTNIFNNQHVEKKLNKWIMICWLIELYLTVHCMMLKVSIMNNKEIQNKEIRKQYSLQLVRATLDSIVALGLFSNDLVSQGKIGVLGIVTSLIGLYQLWH